MIKTFMAAVVAGVFALPVSASAANDNMVVAQGGGADGPDMANRARSATGAARHSGNFDRLDSNRDGYISRDEAKDAAELQTRFSELDTNNDDKLSREEYDALNNHGSRGALGATGSGSGSGAEPRQPGKSPAPGKGGGDSSTSGSNTK